MSAPTSLTRYIVYGRMRETRIWMIKCMCVRYTSKVYTGVCSVVRANDFVVGGTKHSAFPEESGSTLKLQLNAHSSTSTRAAHRNAQRRLFRRILIRKLLSSQITRLYCVSQNNDICDIYLCIEKRRIAIFSICIVNRNVPAELLLFILGLRFTVVQSFLDSCILSNRVVRPAGVPRRKWKRYEISAWYQIIHVWSSYAKDRSQRLRITLHITKVFVIILRYITDIYCVTTGRNYLSQR